MHRLLLAAWLLCALGAGCTDQFLDPPDPGVAVCAEGEQRRCVELEGECARGTQTCTNGRWDPCSTKSDERCDTLDNDCDGLTDEGFLLLQDVQHCGRCGRRCAGAHATNACIEGECVVVACREGYSDADSNPANGCECMPSGGETCDGLDNDCDGLTDEGFALQTDPNHCGGCGRRCQLDHARSGCVGGECAILECLAGWHDVDDQPSNGCEYGCELTEGGRERCDYVDNDCDGSIDEDFDLKRDLNNCGACEQRCVFPHGFYACTEGRCELVSCEGGWVNADGELTTGCELECTPSPGGAERCDEQDNDCDGHTDEDFDLSLDPQHCGACGRTCSLPHAQTACQGGRCLMVSCELGWVDRNESPADGCEAPCGEPELCNGVDDNCDGVPDEEAFPELGEPCAVGLGICRAFGLRVCSPDGRSTRCDAVAGAAQVEVCDERDNDCDGETDEGFDRDADGVTSCGGDCNDAAADIHPGAVELCDRRNNDCDEETDEGFDLLTDVHNCGGCGQRCAPPHAFGRCDDGQCAVLGCRDEWLDVDGEPHNGCERHCVPTEPPRELCDGIDNNCDGVVDEGHDLGAICQGRGRCGVGVLECDTDGELTRCSTLPGGSAYVMQPELCNGEDDDCDGQTDEEVPEALLRTDAHNCSECGRVCSGRQNAHPICVDGVCGFMCRAGFMDADGQEANGCEVDCAGASTVWVQQEGEGDGSQQAPLGDLQAAIRAAGVCGTVALMGTYRVDALETIELNVVGQTLRAVDGARLAQPMEATGATPTLRVTANDVTVDGLGWDGAEQRRRLLSAEGVQGLTLRNLMVDSAVLLFGPDSIDTGPAAAIYLEDVQDALVEGGSLTVGHVLAEGLSGRDVALLHISDSERVRVRDSSFALPHGMALNALAAVVAFVRCQACTLETSHIVTVGLSTSIEEWHRQDSAAGYGVALSESDDCTVQHTEVQSEEFGPMTHGVLVDGRDNVLVGNTLGQAARPGPGSLLPLGVRLTDPRNTLEDNTFQGQPFVHLHGRPDVTVQGLRVELARGWPTNRGAISLSDCPGARVLDNEISVSGDGPERLDLGPQRTGLITVDSADGMLFERNLVVHSGAVLDRSEGPVHGMLVRRAPGAVVRDNTVDLTGFAGGLRVERSEGATLSGNQVTLRGGGDGVELASCADATLAGTVVTADEANAAVRLSDSAGSDLSVVTVAGQGHAAVQLEESPETTVSDLQVNEHAGCAAQTWAYGVLVDEASADVHVDRSRACQEPILLLRDQPGLVLEPLALLAPVAPTSLGKVALVGCPAARLTGLQLAGQGSAPGLYLRDSGDTRISGLRVGAVQVEGGTGVLLERSPGVQIRNVALLGQDLAVRATSCDDLDLGFVTVVGRGSPSYGVIVAESTGARVHHGLFVDLQTPLVGRDLAVDHCGFRGIGQPFADGLLRQANTLYGFDPRFVDPAGDDVHLMADSPYIDRGDPQQDVGAEPAPNGGIVNLGAYGGTAEATPTPAEGVWGGYDFSCAPVPAGVADGDGCTPGPLDPGLPPHEQWVLVCPGTFTMGTDGPPGWWWSSHEQPAHAVQLEHRFLIQATEQTQALWSQHFANPSLHPGERRPVERVTWWSAAAFANTLSRAEGLQECYELHGCDAAAPGDGLSCESATEVGLGCAGYRFCTDAEWEYAARAGTTTPYYNWEAGDTVNERGCLVPNLDLHTVGVYCGSGLDGTAEAASRCPNAWGLYDTLGNVREWVEDRWHSDGYVGAPNDGSAWNSDPVGLTRVARSSTYEAQASDCRVTARNSFGPYLRYEWLGFRLCRSW